MKSDWKSRMKQEVGDVGVPNIGKSMFMLKYGWHKLVWHTVLNNNNNEDDDDNKNNTNILKAKWTRNNSA